MQKQKAHGLTASSLLKQSNREIIKNIVHDQIKIIDTKIATAHSGGFNHIKHELPVNFNINNMDKSDAQTMVYSELLLHYAKSEEEGGKGFTVNINNNARDIAEFHVYWVNGMDAKEREYRKNIIRKYMVGRPF